MKSIFLKIITLFIIIVCLFSIIMIDNNSLLYGAISIVCFVSIRIKNVGLVLILNIN